MSLINCPKCDEEISDEANRCPSCAHPLNETGASQIVQFISGIILILAFGWGVLGLSNIYFGWEKSETFNFVLVMTNIILFVGPSAIVFLIGALLFRRS